VRIDPEGVKQHSPGFAVLREPWVRIQEGGIGTLKEFHRRRNPYHLVELLRSSEVWTRTDPGFAEYREPWAMLC